MPFKSGNMSSTKPLSLVPVYGTQYLRRYSFSGILRGEIVWRCGRLLLGAFSLACSYRIRLSATMYVPFRLLYKMSHRLHGFEIAQAPLLCMTCKSGFWRLCVKDMPASTHSRYKFWTMSAFEQTASKPCSSKAGGFYPSLFGPQRHVDRLFFSSSSFFFSYRFRASPSMETRGEKGREKGK